MGVFHVVKIVFIALFLNFYSLKVEAVNPSTSINAIYQFGDSVSDTGNTFHEAPNVGCSKAPYGETHFNRATGRCSDGRLIVDFLAEALNLPYLRPYLDKAKDTSNGVNFAVAGATALSIESLRKRNITAVGTPSSLPVQLGWFKSHLATLCSNNAECKKKLENSLFIVGVIGGNDYNSAALSGQGNQFNDLTLAILQTISDVVEELISLGATRIVVPGYFQGGPGDLQRAVESLRRRHPEVKLVYGDYTSPYNSLIQNAASLGFDKNRLLEACCAACGSDKQNLCSDPNSRLSWDGLHFTEHAYHVIADGLLKQIQPLIS